MSDSKLSSSDEALLLAAREHFLSRFVQQPSVAGRAPGRVNLIGDHVDYCDGFVLPVALQYSTLVVGSYNQTSTCQVICILPSGEELETSFPVHSSTNPLQPGEPAWANYVKGVVAHFPCEVQGFNAVVVSNVPIGAGLSSSAAVEVALFTFLEALTGTTVDLKEKMLACQKAEHTFPGMPCGIMDQYISVMGRKGQALLIDCRSLEATYIPLSSDDVVIFVTNSNVKHQLTGSEYPQRRAQCQQAGAILGKVSLRNVTNDDLEELRRLNADDEVLRRTEHVVSEIARTVEAAKYLKEENFKRAGDLFFESHESLSKKMEVSCPEVDELIAIQRKTRGVLGARMTGGGFGGCTVALVSKNQIENLKREIRSHFKGNPEFFVCHPSDGASVIKLN